MDPDCRGGGGHGEVFGGAAVLALLIERAGLGNIQVHDRTVSHDSSSSGAKSVPHIPQVMGPAARTVGATRMRRPQSQTQGGGVLVLVVRPPVVLAVRCIRSAVPSAVMVSGVGVSARLGQDGRGPADARVFGDLDPDLGGQGFEPGVVPASMTAGVFDSAYVGQGVGGFV